MTLNANFHFIANCVSNLAHGCQAILNIRRADVLPEKVFKPLKGGVSDGWKLDRAEVEAALDKYFELCGWDIETGIPTQLKLAQLDLGWIDLG